MKLRYLFTLFVAAYMLNVNGQTVHKDVLFTVAKEPVYASEFLRVYNKNLDLVQDESQKDVDEYLKLFKNYKLKLKEARSLGLHEKPSYLRELSSYKKQLAKNYITDSKVTDELVNEAYERMSYEVNATHILVKVDENAKPQDTLAAYNNITKLRERALKEGFENLREKVHNGKTVFGEKLGYFGGFRMVYKFESVAFNTNVGDVSEPFRTRFGYHIINVLDKRKSRGERTVSHIMVVEKKEDSLAEKPEVRIQEIYKKLNQGEGFESLAKQFSDDKNSAPNGGKLKPFSSGQIRAKEFEDVAFNLENVGDVSEPFKTDFGWHIVKLNNKKPIPSFDAMKPELVEKVKKDDRSKLIDNALISKLRNKYNIRDEQPNLDYFVSILNDDYFKRTWKLPKDFDGKQSLVQIGNKQFSNNDFGVYLANSQRDTTIKVPLKSLVSNKYEAFLNDSLIKYQEDNLEFENEDYADIVSEYRDGLLLFDLMENTIWNTAKTDSIEIAKFYEENKANYVKPKQIDAVVASSTKQKTLRKVSKLLTEDMEIDRIKSLVNSNDKIDVIFTSDIMDDTHQALPENFEFNKGISKIYKHNDAFVLVKVKDILPKEQKTFEESKGNVVNDYQNFKEENWLNNLSEKFKIEVNQNVLESIKVQLKNKK
ncbi:MAG: peptidylprolyl isomerase [Algibacter sp.]|uniref:peptidylprolyl isomerase n=1 Tax=Algibacter sp. TaxID=1872428 RepID=UPI00261479B3|nr:peptidylprolyl isomerase [Algibacter sp.]MDG1729956.1 peptidylprolyl isomerase [Algibacter sp.]MDG2177740.1 peptidylprolyl isomerase [Algibacter sp.]